MQLLTRRFLSQVGLVLTFCLCWTQLSLTQLHAEQPIEPFLDGLIQRGYFDQAIYYLEKLESKPNLPPALKNSIPYRKAQTEIAASRGQRNLEIQTELLNSANANLTKFLKDNPKHPDFVDATVQRGNLLLQQAKLNELQASSKKDPASKAPLLAKSRTLYDDARKVFQASITKIKGILEAMPKTLDPAKEADKIERRDKLRSLYVQTNLLAASSLLEKAKIAKAGSDPQKKLLDAAIKEFDEIYSKYRSSLAGSFARLYQGQALQLKNDIEAAVEIYRDELLLIPDRPEGFRRVKLKAVKHLIECWSDGPKKDYKQIRGVCGDWLNRQQFTPGELRDPEWIELKYLLAEALLEEDESLKATKENNALKNALKKEAIALIQEIVRFPSAYKTDAVELRAKIRGADNLADKPEPATFQEAITAGREAISEAQSQNFVIEKLNAQLASSKTPAAEKSQLSQELEAAQATLDAANETARDSFKTAVNLADFETSNDDLNSARYYLCFLDFQAKQYRKALVMGNFVAQHYPSSASAKTCAKLALASTLMLYENNQTPDKSFELRKIQEIVGFMAKQWPDEPETNQALATLVGFQVQQGDLATAKKTLAKIPEAAVERAPAEMKIGQTLWSSYLKSNNALRKAKQNNQPVTDLPTEAELLKMKQEALQNLEAGVVKYAGDANSTYVVAALSLVQLYTNNGTPEKAFSIMDKPSLGLMNLIETNSSAISTPTLKQLIYKGAVRVYVSALANVKTQEETDQLMEKALKVMNDLKAAVGSDAASQKQLIAVYISLANDLKEQLEEAPPENKAVLAKGFETFLNQVADSTKDPLVLNWAGDTFYNLGLNVKSNNASSDQAKQYFEKAKSIYDKIVSDSAAAAANPQLISQVQMRLAMANRALGDYENSIKQFTELLSKNAMMVNVQMEAAQTYHEWGVNDKDQEKLYFAIIGGGNLEKSQPKPIWGWGKIQSALSKFATSDQDPPSPYRDIFFQSRLNLASSRFEFAKVQTDPEKKSKYLKSAKRDISLTKLSFPSMGGDEFTAKFDSLYRKIQKEIGEPVTGLEKS